MHTARIVFTVLMALVLMGCPPPVSDNSASGSNAPLQSGDNPDNSASGGNAPEPQPKAIVVDYVSSGKLHTMIVKSDDTLWAVGSNAFGQLGDGNTDQKLDPAKVLPGIAQVSSGDKHSMIITTEDTLWAVGDNQYGQLGNDESDDVVEVTPVQVKTAEGEPMTEVAQVSAGGRHSMILKKNGSLWAVGSNTLGQLGNGDIQLANKSTPAPVLELPPGADPARPMTNVDYVSSGSFHTMIVKGNGELWAVGSNGTGQLGDGTNDDRLTAVQVKEKVPGGELIPMTEVDQVSAGYQHSMILKENGDLWAVGLNLYGQLGDGTRDDKKIPVQVKTADGRPMTEVAQVSAGTYHSMILKKNGELWALGSNEEGQLGDGKGGDFAVFEVTPIKIMDGVAQVSAGEKHSMIVKTNGELWAVGINTSGQLGDGSIVDKKTPVEITVQ